MSLFGEALPFEDDTAASLIRRSGFPPESGYAQMPEIYLCPCCSEFSKQQERERLLREARDAKEAERRRLLQLDVFEERARPLPSGDSRRKAYRRIQEGEELADTAPNVPPPPPTLDELRRAKRDQNVPKLVVTVHCGRNLSANPDDLVSVIVRCGAFEGQTEKVPRGKDTAASWEELFEFPYMNPNEPLEVLVMNDALPCTDDQLIGGVMIPCSALHDRSRGDQEPLPVMPEDAMRSGYGTCQEGPLGTIVASWYVRDGEEKIDEEAIEKQTLNMPLSCTFAAHHLFQYTDHGAVPYTGGVLCVLRDTDDNCSESVLYTPGSQAERSLSPYYTKEGFYYLPENASQLMQLNTEKKLGHILVCVPKQEDPSSAEEEELLVIGAVPLEFERLYNKGKAVLLIESKSKEDALWGEISIEWYNKPLDEEDLHPASLDVKKESLFVTVVRGVNLSHRDGEPVKEGNVSVATGELEGVTVEAPSIMDEDGNRVICWNQEVRFIDVNKYQKDVEVQLYERGRLVSVGTCELEQNDDGVIIMPLKHAADASKSCGEVVLSYKRLHVTSPKEALLPRQRGVAQGSVKKGEDEEDEEDEEEEEDKKTWRRSGARMARRAMSINEELSKGGSAYSEGAGAAGADSGRAYSEGAGAAGADSGRAYSEGADAEGADSGRAYSEGADAEGADSGRAYSEGADAERADSGRAYSEGADAERADSGRAYSEGAGAAGADSGRAYSEGADAEGADSGRAYSEGAGAEGADAEGAGSERAGSERAVSESAVSERAGSEAAVQGERTSGKADDQDEPQSLMYEGEEDSQQRQYRAEAQSEERRRMQGEEGEYSEEGKEKEREGVRFHDYDPEDDNAVSDSAREEVSGLYPLATEKLRPRRISWEARSAKGLDYKQPWYPAGAPETDQHIPFSKTKLSKKNIESIRQLETCKMRIEEESVRRSLTPRRSPSRGVSPSSQ
ncbi:hypothetical protein CUR178_04836 [Leishmania enriettii]|uniref:C2 domain-containing protein n=1 Tax=Leishmania enriettii TaxID=5663 RepID=A0A836GXS8_LEIEN|nr:hypothetical protein CUR178_04836 [Leishmania enriettii]